MIGRGISSEREHVKREFKSVCVVVRLEEEGP